MRTDGNPLEGPNLNLLREPKIAGGRTSCDTAQIKMLMPSKMPHRDDAVQCFQVDMIVSGTGTNF